MLLNKVIAYFQNIGLKCGKLLMRYLLNLGTSVLEKEKKNRLSGRILFLIKIQFKIFSLRSLDHLLFNIVPVLNN